MHEYNARNELTTRIGTLTATIGIKTPTPLESDCGIVDCAILVIGDRLISIPHFIRYIAPDATDTFTSPAVTRANSTCVINDAEIDVEVTFSRTVALSDDIVVKLQDVLRDLVADMTTYAVSVLAKEQSAAAQQHYKETSRQMFRETLGNPSSLFDMLSGLIGDPTRIRDTFGGNTSVLDDLEREFAGGGMPS